MDNMELWNKVKTPPKTALKTIQAGRLKGKSDINPQWRYQVMTENFGMCGVGWKYEIVSKWTEQGSHEQLMCFMEINLFVKVDGEWSAAIPATGGSSLIEKESSGLYSSDEGYKMALTDALSVGMKMLGVGADVYLGQMENSKYIKPETTPQKKPIPTPTNLEPEAITDAQRELIVDLILRKGSDTQSILAFYKVKNFTELNYINADKLIKILETKPDREIKDEELPE